MERKKGMTLKGAAITPKLRLDANPVELVSN
jgi:hypothetical protein